MGFLLLGIDSFIACMAIGAIVDKRWRLPLAAAFGIADGAAFLIGAGLGWTISAGVTVVLEVGTLAALGIWLIVVAAGTRRAAELWPLWALPIALTMDNLAFGVASDYSGSLARARRGAGGVECPARARRPRRGGCRRPAPGSGPAESGGRYPVRGSRVACCDRRVPIDWLVKVDLGVPQ